MKKEAHSEEVEDLRSRLREAEETLEAIQSGVADAIVVSGKTGEQVYTLQGTDQPYRRLVESISEGALMLTAEGVILYANQRIANMLGIPLDQVIGTSFLKFVSIDRQLIEQFFQNHETEIFRFQSLLLTATGNTISTQISLSSSNSIGNRHFDAVITDLTDQKKLEEALHKGEEQLRIATDSAAIGVYDYDFIQAKAFYSDKFLELYGLTPDGTLKLDADLFAMNLHPGDKANFQTHMTAANDPTGSGILDLDYRIVIANDEIRWLRVKGQTFFSGNTTADSPLRSTGIIQDITERRQSEEELRLQGEVMANMSEGVILVKTTDGTIVYTNPKYEEMFGYDPGELIGQNVSVLNAPTDKTPEEIAEEIQIELRCKGLWSGEVRNMKKNGKTFWTFANVSTINHTVYGDVWVCVQTDITERKRAEKSLQVSETLFRNTFEKAAVGIANVSLEGRFLRINQRFCDIMEYSMEEMLSMTFKDITHPDDLKTDLNYIQQAIEGLIDNFSFEKRYIKKDGHLVWVKLTVHLLREESGKPMYFISAITDVTDNKQLQDELESYKKHLEGMIEERTIELEAKNITLQELNATLRTLLKQREDDKKDTEERFVINVRDLVLPFVGHLKKGHLDVRQQTYLDLLEKRLQEITTPLLKNVRQFNLTPKEIQVAALVSQGKSTKEIAQILGAGSGSISTHRKSIRKKLGLSARKANLQSHLEMLEQ